MVITFGAVGGPAEERESISHEETTVAGLPAWRNEDPVNTPAGATRHLVYQVFLGGTPTDGPTLIVQSATEDEDEDYALHTAVLDRMMASLVVE